MSTALKTCPTCREANLCTCSYHGSPADRGSADAYYHRSKHPHKYPSGTYNGLEVTDLTPPELAAYNQAYDSETDRKVW